MKSGKAQEGQAEHPADRLTTLRSRIAELKTTIEQSESAYVSRDEAVKRIDDYITRNAVAAVEQSAARRFMYAEHRDIALLSEYRLERQVEQLLAWVAPKELRERLIALVDSTYASLGPSDAMSAADRAEARKRAVADLFATEVEEERLIVEAESQGIVLNRRGDADPAAILAA